MIKIDDKIIEQNHFPDGTLRMKMPSDCFNKDITWLYESDSELFTLQCIVAHLKNIYGNHQITTLIMPYVPHARMDRVKAETDVFTLKTFCNIINNMNFTRVLICDPHSDVTPALLNNCTVLLDEIDLFQQISLRVGDSIVFYPDAGAAKRYDYPDKKYTYGIKNRDWDTGKIKSLKIAEPEIIKNQNIIIVDDICSYGGTFARAAAALKSEGAKNIYLCVTHCEKNIFKGDIFKEGNIKKVYTTNSLLKETDIPDEYKEQIKIFNFYS